MKKSFLLLAVLLITLTGCGKTDVDLSNAATINGTYYYLGEFETMGITPLEGQGTAIMNVEETLDLMGISDDYLSECPDFYGSGELAVESIEIPEDETYGTAPRVNVIGIISNSGTTCGKYQ